MKKGLSREVVEEISRIKGEPQWMTDLRLKAYRHFEARPMPTWGGDLARSTSRTSSTTSPPPIRRSSPGTTCPTTSGAPTTSWASRRRRRSTSPASAGQYDSEVVYHNIRADLEKLGVIFMGTDQALQEYPEIFKEYFGTVIPANDNKLAALNTAVWSGGSFIYVPKGVHVELPLQAYFRINTENMGQFERTLIIADEGSSVHYVEGCTAPAYTTAVPAQRRRRDHRQEGRAGPLHDDPELEPQRLQPRHQACGRLRGRGDGVGRRQPRARK